MKTENIYLGDSVYAYVQEGYIVLITENGSGPSSRIFLEPEVANALRQFIDRVLGGEER